MSDGALIWWTETMNMQILWRCLVRKHFHTAILDTPVSNIPNSRSPCLVLMANTNYVESIKGIADSVKIIVTVRLVFQTYIRDTTVFTWKRWCTKCLHRRVNFDCALLTGKQHQWGVIFKIWFRECITGSDIQNLVINVCGAKCYPNDTKLI